MSPRRRRIRNVRSLDTRLWRPSPTSDAMLPLPLPHPAWWTLPCRPTRAAISAADLQGVALAATYGRAHLGDELLEALLAKLPAEIVRLHGVFDRLRSTLLSHWKPPLARAKSAVLAALGSCAPGASRRGSLPFRTHQLPHLLYYAALTWRARLEPSNPFCLWGQGWAPGSASQPALWSCSLLPLVQASLARRQPQRSLPQLGPSRRRGCKDLSWSLRPRCGGAVADWCSLAT